MAEWRSEDGYLQRIGEINGTKSRDNDVYFLNATTVYDAAAHDVLTGGTGRNWYFAGSGDTITNLKSNEITS